MSDARLDLLRDELVAAEGHIEAAARLLDEMDEPGPVQPDLLTVSEAARRLAIHRNTALAMVKDGRLEGVKVGTRYRVKRASVERFAAGSVAKSLPSP